MPGTADTVPTVAGGPCASPAYPAEGSRSKLIKAWLNPDLTETTVLWNAVSLA